MANDAVEEAEEDAELEEVQEVEEEVEEAKPAKKHGGKKHYGGKKPKSPPKALFTLTSTNSDGVSRFTINLALKVLFSKTQRNRQPSPVRVTRSSSVTTTGRLPKVMRVKSSEIQKATK